MKPRTLLLILLLSLGWFRSLASGIPEPGLVLYGNVTNANRALRRGLLTLEFTGQGGAVVRVTAQLSETGPYAYRVRVPYETLVGGGTASADAFTLTSATSSIRLTAPATFGTGGATVYPATFGLGSTEFAMNASTRGLTREVNFRVDAVLPLSNPIKLVEARLTSVDGNGGAGQAGTTAFQFTSIAATREPGVLVEWSGAPANRGYYLLRSSSLTEAASDYAVVRWFPASSLTSNSHWDTNAVSSSPYFYRLWVP